MMQHRQFLEHGLVFPQINVTMKPQFLHGVISQNYFIKQIDMGSIQSLAVESWNKIQKQLKDILLKDLSPRKIKAIVILNHINSSLIMHK